MVSKSKDMTVGDVLYQAQDQSAKDAAYPCPLEAIEAFVTVDGELMEIIDAEN